MKTKGDGYTVEVADGFYDDGGRYYDPFYLTFPSFKDFRIIHFIENRMYKLYN